MPIHITTILPAYNAAIAKIIKDALTEFKANKPGTVFFDSSTNDLYTLFSSTPNSVYFIALNNTTVIGGAGIYPTENLPLATAELVKMYLHPNYRNKGLGKLLIEKCLQWAKQQNYKQVYLETMPELKKAVAVYEKFGFTYLPHALGNSGHTGCDIWMIKEL
jgi:putative acetyltransferase